ncbi:sensor domain-containing diguanylate cyclase [Desulfarculus baarsii]
MPRRLAIVVFAALLALPRLAEAASLVVSPRMTDLNLSAAMEYLPDPHNNLSLAQVSAPPLRQAFRPGGPTGLVLPKDIDYYWLRLRVRAADDWPDHGPGWVLFSDNIYLQELTLHQPPGPDGRRHVQAGGGMYQPFAWRQLAGRYPAFLLPRPQPGQELEIFLRMRTVPVIPIAFFGDSLAAHTAGALADDYVFGLCFGVLLTMIIYNLFLGISLRDRAYLVYVLYIFGMLAAGLFMYGQAQMLWDFQSELYGRLFWFFMGWLTCMAYAFMRVFLGLRPLAPRLDALLRACMAYGLVISLLGLFAQYHLAWALTTASGFFSPVLAVLAGVMALRAGYRPARYYLAAWSILALATFIFVLREVGLIDGGDLVRRSLLVGSALESMLLSLALADRIRLLRQEKDILRHRALLLGRLSQTDGLTGLFNKRHFDQELPAQVRRASESGAPLCLLMLDVDDFKAFNDNHGHPAGDQVLQALAETIRASLRQADAAFRYGGEEFAVLLPDMSAEQAAAVGQRIRQTFACQSFLTAHGAVSCGVSLGLACLGQGEDAASLLRRADAALYQAKRQGKNRLATAG